MNVRYESFVDANAIRERMQADIAKKRYTLDIVQQIIASLQAMNGKKVTVRFKSAVDIPGHTISYFKESGPYGNITLSVYKENYQNRITVNLQRYNKLQTGIFDFKEFVERECKPYLMNAERIKKLEALLNESGKLESICDTYNNALTAMKQAEETLSEAGAHYYLSK